MHTFKKSPVKLAIAAAGLMAFSTAQAVDYELWATDQSNSPRSGVTATSKGSDGSWLNIWSAGAINGFADGPTDAGLNGSPVPDIGCPINGGASSPAPCNIHDMFPDNLVESNAGGLTGATLADIGPIGRVHGAIPDPQHLYVNINFFKPGLGLVGIVDGRTKEAVALFRVTGTNTGRSLHMSFWNADGSQLLLANLHGRVLERIDIERDPDGNITAAHFNQSASMGVGATSIAAADSAKAYTGTNGAGNAMIGDVTGSYATEATAVDFTDANGDTICRQNGCSGGAIDGGRPGNVIVCPIVSANNKVFVTFGGGGLLIADADSTPMKIVGAYGNDVVNGAGCGGVEIAGKVFLNAGASASGAGATQSTFTQYRLSTSAFGDGDAAVTFKHNLPEPDVLFSDFSNTQTGGNSTGIGGFASNSGTLSTNTSGQIPGTTSRRDAHGMTPTMSGNFLHVVDRIQNNMEVFDTDTLAKSTYDLTSGNGCGEYGVTDDAGLPSNDPAPDLMATGPNNKYLFVAQRGPIPVTVGHAGQGSCPGAGIITLDAGSHGKSGSLKHVLRTSNTIAPADPISYGTATAGHNYTGAETSDIHGVSVRISTQ